MRSFAKPIKPFINLGLVGETRADRLALTSAVTRVLSFQKQATFISVANLEEFDPNERHCFGWNLPYVQFTTDCFNVRLFDFMSDQQSRHLVISDYAGLDGLILVVNEAEGISDQTENLVALAARLELPITAVFEVV